MPKRKSKRSKRTKKQRFSPSRSRRFLRYSLIVVLFLALALGYHHWIAEKVFLSKSSQNENLEKIALEREIRQLVKGYPIEKMVPDIMQQDQLVAIFLVSIAKKESNWGKRAPKYKGQDCFNYWGYRGPNRLGSGQHSCFASRKEAVEIVGKRIAKLVKEGKRTTPRQMIIWKCGSSCQTHSPASVEKWIADVELYFQKLSH